ncbi:hypothetical protein [Pseudidiomarina taiwanensis]|uniref:Uncharacterized protein n=1 Tax=Pseudidiomarina taiwanensis TaxID=337250 RepID=A0A432ZET4_9GAMM|nr:hypothetical protein [Pseudidiomarina taiwanensis]RUO76485.1 hypothetical protein CWI83_09005 [Pseudidiomarina taiwanensis]
MDDNDANICFDKTSHLAPGLDEQLIQEIIQNIDELKLRQAALKGRSNAIEFLSSKGMDTDSVARSLRFDNSVLNEEIKTLSEWVEHNSYG